MSWIISIFGGIWGSISKYLAIAGAAIVAVGAALVYGRSKGKQEVEEKDAAEQGQQVAHAAEKRNEIEETVDRLPAAETTRVGDAPPASAAGELRTDGWTRD